MLLALLLLGCAPEEKPDPRWIDGDLDGWRPGDGDCDDQDPDDNPDEAEVCDGQDNDCDGNIDEDPQNGDTWYADEDGDGFGNPLLSFPACGEAAGRTLDDSDCDDQSAEAFPGGIERCDGVDNDCNGIADDDAPDVLTWHVDDDGDGFGNANSADSGCEAPPGAVEDGSDCNDADATVFPGAPDDCDGLDNDCDGREVCALACDLTLAGTLAVDLDELDGLAFADGRLYAVAPTHSPDMIYGLDPATGATIDTFVSDAEAVGGLGAEGDLLYVPGEDLSTYNLVSHSWNEIVENPCRGARAGAAALGGVVWQACQLGDGADMVFAGTDPLTGGLVASLPIPESWGTAPAELDADGEHLLYVSENPLCDAMECPTELHIFGTDGVEVCSQTLFTDSTITVSGLAAGPGALYVGDAAGRQILVFRSSP